MKEQRLKKKEKLKKKSPYDYDLDIEVNRKNEIDANNSMVSAALVTAVLFIIVYTLFHVGVLPIGSKVLVHIFMPANIVLLASTWVVKKTRLFYKPTFKLYILGTFVFAFFVLGCIAPKHGVLTWAIPIVLANHYYTPKVGRIIFINCLIGMLLSLYIGAFIGEYDNNLLGPGMVVYNVPADQLNSEYIPVLAVDGSTEYYIYQPDDVMKRIQMVNTLAANGDNRYLKIFLFYFFGRGLALFIIYYASYSLTLRTSELLTNEVASRQEKRTIETELEIAQGIQQGVLPPAYSSFKDLTLFAELKATKEVGGDLYYYFPLDDTHIAFCIGDVSGKGVPAAMFMMKTITCLKAYSSIDKHPSEILKETNLALIEGNDELQMFVTCFFGILDTETGVLEYCNAGHNKPVIGHNDKYQFLECSAGFILGALEFTPLKDEKTKLHKGDHIFLYTDGITEAKNNENELYGELRLLRLLNSKKYSSILETHYELKEDIASFVNGADQADDMTYLYLAYQGDEIYARELNVDATIENVREVLQFSEQCLKETNNEKYTQKFYVVVDELASNIVKYAYPNEPLGLYFRFLYNKTQHQIILTFIDRGIPFDPIKTDKGKETVDIDGPEGGLGIHIVKNLVDSITYNRVNNRNILMLTMDTNRR
ncbi:MAG: SpoIIE family protein phosphatase [Bacilli bacterium]|nr:SpoIIE family protein phosphatase [Bacilli bacterium]